VSDFLVHQFNPELAVVLGGCAFAVTLWWQMQRRHYRAVPYWATVSMVAIFGTMAADVVHVALHVAYAVSSAVFALVLTVIFVGWYRSEGSLDIHQVVTTRRELFYWATVSATFALGTALGDFSAATLQLGYLRSIAVFALLVLTPGLLFAVTRRMAVGLFWSAYVMTRPLGASVADYLGRSRLSGGVGFGPGHAAVLLLVLLVTAVFALSRSRTTRV
jgi:uncharacterized membrane-anchored protein